MVTDVPVLAERRRQAAAASGGLPDPRLRRSRRDMRAVHYASTLGFEDTKAIFFAFDAEDAARMRQRVA